jgi:hypothetical protein
VSNITKEQDDVDESIKKLDIKEALLKYEEYLFNNYIKVKERIKDECA